MSSSKISPVLPLYIGAVFIAVAAIGLVISVVRGDDEEVVDSPPQKSPRVVATRR